MSVSFRVYAGIGVKLINPPDDWKSIVEELCRDRFFIPKDANGNPYPYLLPNQGEGAGVTFGKYEDNEPIECYLSVTEKMMEVFRKEFYEELYVISNGLGWTYEVGFIVVGYWQ